MYELLMVRLALQMVTMKCTPSPNTLFSTAPTYNTTPLCPACTMTTDSDITIIITINVAIAGNN